MSTKRDMGERGCWTKEQNKSESSLFDPERIEDSDFINASNLIHYCFKFDSIKRKMVSIKLHADHNNV